MHHDRTQCFELRTLRPRNSSASAGHHRVGPLELVEHADPGHASSQLRPEEDTPLDATDRGASRQTKVIDASER